VLSLPSLLSQSFHKNIAAQRRPRLTTRGDIIIIIIIIIIIYSFYFFLKSLCERSARETSHSYRRHLLLHTTVTTVTTEFGYAKRDLCLTAYGGVVLQRFEFIKVCMGKNGN